MVKMILWNDPCCNDLHIARASPRESNLSTGAPVFPPSEKTAVELRGLGMWLCPLLAQHEATWAHVVLSQLQWQQS